MCSKAWKLARVNTYNLLNYTALCTNATCNYCTEHAVGLLLWLLRPPFQNDRTPKGLPAANGDMLLRYVPYEVDFLDKYVPTHLCTSSPSYRAI